MYYWVLVALVLGVVYYFLGAKKVDGMPAVPGAIPFFGHMFIVMKQIPRLTFFQYDIVRDLKSTCWFSVPGRLLITVTTTDEVEHILKKNFDNYVKGPLFHDAFEELLGDGIFAADGETWRRQRKIASHMFSLRTLRDRMTIAFTEKVPIALRILDNVAAGADFDIQSLFTKFTLDSICDIAFGRKDINTLEKNHPFGYAFEQANHICTIRTVKPPLLWKFQRLFSLGKEAQLKQHVKVLQAAVDTIVGTRMDEYKNGSGAEGDLLSLFLDDHTKKGTTPTSKELYDVVMNFVIAGRDTTAWAMTAVIFLLAHHTHVQQKIVHELNEQVGRAESINYETAKKLTYLKAVIQEALRLYPSVPSDIKQCIKQDILPSGFTIPAGAIVSYPIYALSRSQEIWGEDASDFKPERMINQEIKMSEYKYPIFNAGPRSCLGKETAFLECTVLLGEMLRKYKFTISEKNKMDFLFGATFSLVGGLIVQVHKL